MINRQGWEERVGTNLFIMEQQLEFSCLYDNSNGVLSPDDLLFFYYSVGLDTFMGIPAVFQETTEVTSFINTRNLTIEERDQDKLPTNYEDDHIYFIIEKCDKTKYDAFYRHLRNSFAHYRINRSGNYFIMKDCRSNNETQISMIGKIKERDLKDLTEIFYKQRQDGEDNC